VTEPRYPLRADLDAPALVATLTLEGRVSVAVVGNRSELTRLREDIAANEALTRWVAATFVLAGLGADDDEEAES
jgi:hypothetical protein